MNRVKSSGGVSFRIMASITAERNSTNRQGEDRHQGSYKLNLLGVKVQKNRKEFRGLSDSSTAPKGL